MQIGKKKKSLLAAATAADVDLRKRERLIKLVDVVVAVLLGGVDFH
ncbi:unnamed protein product [Rhodiola kirilowii]